MAEETETIQTQQSVKDWLLMRGNRLLVTGLLAVFVFVGFVGTVAVLQPSFPQKVVAGDPIDTLFASMITVIVTGTTLVVTIGQLILTQENGPLGDQRERMSNSMEVRDEIRDVIDEQIPTDPAEFLGVILDATIQKARALDNAFDQSSDPSLQSNVESFTDGVNKNASEVRERLRGGDFGRFDVLSASLNFAYGSKIAQIEQFLADDHALSDHQRDRFEELKGVLVLFGPAREHIKTLYFQWGLINLSQLILYAAVPAVVLAGIAIANVDTGTFPGQTLGIDHLTYAVGVMLAVSLLPFLLFVSYILRILTVAKRTLAIEPLVLLESE